MGTQALTQYGRLTTESLKARTTPLTYLTSALAVLNRVDAPRMPL